MEPIACACPRQCVGQLARTEATACSIVSVQISIMDTADSYQHVADKLLTRASKEDGIRAEVLVELAGLFLAGEVESIELIGFAIELTKSLNKTVS
jgi:hypothetical protein